MISYPIIISIFYSLMAFNASLIATNIGETSAYSTKAPKKFKKQNQNRSAAKINKERKKWTLAEDQQLINFIVGKKIVVGTFKGAVPGRNAKQCRERWNNYLSPEVNEAPIGAEELAKIIALKQHNIRWKKIANNIGNGRTGLQVKNTWHRANRNSNKNAKTTRKSILSYEHFLYNPNLIPLSYSYEVELLDSWLND